MKKITLLLAGGLWSTTAFSQTPVPVPMEVIVANGGIFEFVQPYNDHATVGTYDIQSGSYTTFDTIRVESVQDISIVPSWNGVGAGIYVAAQDSIVMYDALYQRQNVTHFPGIRSIRAFAQDFRVVAGKWFGAGDYVSVYDLNMNLQFSITDTDIPYTVYDAAIEGDTLYVAYNFPSTVDACPPYGCFGDSLGMIGVISLGSQSYVRSINLGTDGAAVRTLHKANNSIYAVTAATGSGKIIQYDLATQNTTVINTAVTNQLNDFDLNFNGIFAYMDTLGLVTDGSSGNTVTSISNTSMNTGAYEFEYGDLFYTSTDFATFGKLFRKNASDQIIDSVDVDISPDAIAVRYDIVGGISDQEITAKIYPNPSNGMVTIESQNINSIEVYSSIGKLVANHSLLSQDRFQLDLPRGLFFIRIKTEYGESTRKVVIR